MLITRLTIRLGALLTVIFGGLVALLQHDYHAQLAFATETETGFDIILIDTHTRDWRKIGESIGGAGKLAWLPDGESLLYDNDMEVYRLSLADGSRVQLTTHVTPLNTGASVSPDGRSIVYLSSGFYSSVWIMDVDGGDQRQVGDLQIYGERPPVWSPNGSRLGLVVAGEESADIAIMDADGGIARNLTADGLLNDDFAWSPDGTEIAYMEGNASDFRLVIQTLATGGTRTVIENPASVARPSWSPDGRWFVFAMRAVRGPYYLYGMEMPGGRIHRLIEHDIAPSWMSWSPDGSLLALVAYDDRGVPVPYLVDVAHRVAMPLSERRGVYINPPVWRPVQAHAR